MRISKWIVVPVRIAKRIDFSLNKRVHIAISLAIWLLVWASLRGFL